MTRPPVLSTVTVGMIAERIAHLLSPWVDVLGLYITNHIAVVFPVGYKSELEATFEMAVVGLAIWWHIAEPPATKVDPSS